MNWKVSVVIPGAKLLLKQNNLVGMESLQLCTNFSSSRSFLQALWWHRSELGDPVMNQVLWLICKWNHALSVVNEWSRWDLKIAWLCLVVSCSCHSCLPSSACVCFSCWKKPSVSTEGIWTVELENWGRIGRKSEAVCRRDLCDGCPVPLWSFTGKALVFSSFLRLPLPVTTE